MRSTLGKYQLGRTLGSGVSCKVKVAKDSTNKRVAIKILHSEPIFHELSKQEVKTLKDLNHPNIVNLIEEGQAMLIHPKKESKKVDYIVLELVQGGELFDYVANSGRFTEPICRYYFG
jgi:serine/threonine protein kinase